jgi:hypothetical protein
MLAAADGTVASRLPVPEGTDDVRQRAAGTVALILVGGTLSALDATSGTPLWETAATGLPAGPDAVEGADDRAPLLVPEADGFVHRDPGTGSELDRSAATGVPAGGVASEIGPVVVYRLPDRVLGYR